jgi:predicted nucleic acid-binding protein
MKLIDTDIVIDHFHGHQAALEYFAEAIAAGETLAISVVTLAELTSGLRTGEETRTEHLLSLFTVMHPAQSPPARRRRNARDGPLRR